MDLLSQILVYFLLIWLYGWTGRWATQEGTKKGYDPVWSAINGVRFGLLAAAYYKWLAPDLTKGQEKKEL